MTAIRLQLIKEAKWVMVVLILNRQPCKLNFAPSPVKTTTNWNMQVNTCANQSLSAELINLFSESPFTPVISSSGRWRKRRAETDGSYFHPIPLSFWSYLVFSLLFLGEESAKNANDILLISTGRRCSETHSLWWSDKKAGISIRGKMSWNWGSQWKTRG